jgi:hypothetical protein
LNSGQCRKPDDVPQHDFAAPERRDQHAIERPARALAHEGDRGQHRRAAADRGR